MNQGKALGPQPPWLRRAALLIAMTLGLLAVFRLSATAAIYLPFSHIDGAFQTASGLFRLQDGQLPGRDFFPYLGVGVLFSVYPLFLLYGGDFAASIAGAHMAAALAQAVALAVVLFFCNGGRQWGPALALGLLATALALLWSDPPALLAERLTPGNSLRPLRSALPYLAVLPVYWALQRQTYAAHAVLGLCAGLAMIWSNDFALPTAFGCGLAFLYCLAQQRKLRFWAAGSLLFMLGLLGGLLPLLFATAGHLPALLRFNLIDVAGDQWWYYGPWNEEARIFGPSDLHRLLDWPTLSSLALLFGLLIAARLRRRLELLALAWLGAVLLLGGVLASVGGHLGGYFPPFHFWALLTGLSMLIVPPSRAAARSWSARSGRSFVPIAALLAGASITTLLAHLDGREVERFAEQDEAHFYVPELGGRINRDWKPYIQFIRESDPDEDVLEEYWGFWSALRRPRPLLPVDSLIHVLGRLRATAEEILDGEPEYIVTTLPHGWQTWSLSANYWLYRVLLEEYQAVITSPATVVWQRQPQKLSWQELGCAIDSSGTNVEVEALQRGYYELELEHRPVPGGRRVTLLRTDAVDAYYGWAALQPGNTRTIVPAFAPSAGLHRHPTKVLPQRAGLALELTQCRARQMSRQDPHLFASAAAAFPTSDSIWQQGLARELPLIRLMETLDNRQQLVAGARIALGEGQHAREVVAAQAHPPWLDVRFEGEPIDLGDQPVPTRFNFEPSPTPEPRPAISPGERRPF